MNSAEMFQEFGSNHKLVMTSSYEELSAEPLSMEQEKVSALQLWFH